MFSYFPLPGKRPSPLTFVELKDMLKEKEALDQVSWKVFVCAVSIVALKVIVCAVSIFALFRL
jgi:hypothetical protein